MIAFVLSRRDFRETDQIITLYTLEKGKIEALAKGIKKIISKNSAFLEPFFLVEAEIIAGKELNRLASVQPVESFKKIRADLAKSLSAGMVVNFISRLLYDNEREIKIFNLLHGWLNYLENLDKSSAVLSFSFMVKLLAMLGFVPELNRCVVCNKKFLNSALNSKVFFNPAAGGIVCSVCLAKRKKMEEHYLVLSGGDIKVWQELLNNDWNKIPSAVSDKLSQTIYEFAEYHSERKIDRGINCIL